MNREAGNRRTSEYRKKKSDKTPIPIEILYQDEVIFVVDKPPGMLVHPNQYDRKTPSLVNSLSGKMHAKVYPVHRLDKDTSGLILFSRDKAAAAKLGEQFSDSRVLKKYHAVVFGTLDTPAEVTAPIRQGGKGEKQPALSRIRFLAEAQIEGVQLSLVEIELETGRNHQARIHCEILGKPIVGDRQHGWKEPNAELARILNLPEWTPMFLRSMELGFDHPMDGRRMFFSEGYPGMWQALLEPLFREIQ
ncbi:RluA family pseudouridine synthase [Salinispira pacifica]|uniref:Ribosomal large subunit pseudouridine synthase D n=1 Tax=Salinispira pacifica TaxID=1307761 RepID=V5WD77_9SPIO|nr:RluA family pseudouridine synthase [Salinispira pacifica]AHC13752.1 Ribosomal large subunit pseudouridine synthase D [Salinispira pacifica]